MPLFLICNKFILDWVRLEPEPGSGLAHVVMYKEGAFRTLYINEAFEDKTLIPNKKGLLFVEQPFWEFNTIPCVRKKGLEPPRLAAPDPKSGAATNYATSAFGFLECAKIA
jgi:hypothetical protein